MHRTDVASVLDLVQPVAKAIKQVKFSSDVKVRIIETSTVDFLGQLEYSILAPYPISHIKKLAVIRKNRSQREPLTHIRTNKYVSLFLVYSEE